MPIDTSYANNGRAFFAVSDPAYQSQDIRQVVSDSSGAATLFGVSSQTFVSGTTALTQQPAATMVRLFADGSLDAAIGTKFYFQKYPASIYPAEVARVSVAALPDGRWLSLTQAGGPSFPWTLTRLSASGVVDASFASGGQLQIAVPATSAYAATTDSRLSGIAIDNTGRTLISGNFTVAGNRVCPAVMRLKTDLSLDTAFGIQGVTAGECGNVEAKTLLKVLDSGKILVASIGSVNATNRFDGVTIRRFNVDGSLDLSYAAGGIVRVDLDEGTLTTCTDNTHDDAQWAFDANGNVYIGATLRCLAAFSAKTIGQKFHGAVARITADGKLDPTFGIGGRFSTLQPANGQDEYLKGISVTSDAKLTLFTTVRKDSNSPMTWAVYRIR